MAQIISKRVLEDIRFRTDIVDLIGSSLGLKRAGSSFKALCPFHKEKTPSFHVNPQRQIFHCFGCGAGGDVFGFLMKYEGVDFSTAARMLAQRAGVKLELEAGGPEDSDKEVLYKLHEAVASLYHHALLERESAAHARAYVEKRALTPEIVEEFLIGYAPNRWDSVLTWAQREKYPLALVERAGLILKKTDGADYYDRFRNRLMFPILDAQGRVIAFSGRTLEEKSEGAKYVNSPETPLFRKSRVLYALDKARRHIVDSREAIICEGQIDVIRCHQAGFKAAVASQGTAFTEDHAQIIQRYADSVCLSFDSDKAGQDAAVKVSGLFMAAGLAVRIAVLPEHEDADSFIRKNGGEAFRKLIDNAESAVAFHIRVLSGRENRDSEVGAMRIAKAVLHTIGQSPNAVQRAKLIQEAAELLNLPASALQDELRRITAKHSAPVRASAEETSASAAIPEHPQDEVELCEHMIHVVDFPKMREVVEQCLPLDMVTDPICRTVVKAALDSTAEGGDFQRTLNHEQDPSGELQRFAAQIQMAPNKSTGRETARVDAVKALILCLWRKRLQQERGTLGPDQAERAHQITLDLQALKHWADGCAIIKIRLAG